VLPTTTLAEQANRHHADAQAKAQEAVQHAIEAGRLLTEAKAQVAHGQWSTWLADNFIGSARTAREYMKLSTRLDALPESKRQHAANLPSLRQALEAVTDGDSTSKQMSAETAQPSWLPTDENILAVVHFDEVIRDPVYIDGHFEGHDESAPTLWIQRTPEDALKQVEDDQEPLYEYVFFDGFRRVKSCKPAMGWVVCHLAMMEVAGRRTKDGTSAKIVPSSAPKGEMVAALAGLGWDMVEAAPGMVHSFTQGMRLKNAGLTQLSLDAFAGRY